MRRSWRWPSIYLACTRTMTACSTTAAEKVKLGEEEMVARSGILGEEWGGEGDAGQVSDGGQLINPRGPRHGAAKASRTAWPSATVATVR